MITFKFYYNVIFQLLFCKSLISFFMMQRNYNGYNYDTF